MTSETLRKILLLAKTVKNSQLGDLMRLLLCLVAFDRETKYIFGLR